MSEVASRDLSHLGDYDVVVIGAGIVGAMIARELSKLDGRFVVLEKENFPTFGVSKASLSQIHLPDFCPPRSLKGKLSKDAPDGSNDWLASSAWFIEKLTSFGWLWNPPI